MGGSRGGGGARGHGSPIALKVLFPPPPPRAHGSPIALKVLFPPPTESFRQKTLFTFLFLFWRILKQKWPKSEDKLEFGVRLGPVWGPTVWPQPNLTPPPKSSFSSDFDHFILKIRQYKNKK